MCGEVVVHVSVSCLRREQDMGDGGGGGGCTKNTPRDPGRWKSLQPRAKRTVCDVNQSEKKKGAFPRGAGLLEALRFWYSRVQARRVLRLWVVWSYFVSIGFPTWKVSVSLFRSV